jgi:hypothetical protein
MGAAGVEWPGEARRGMAGKAIKHERQQRSRTSMTIQQELERLKEANGGILKPEAVVEFARDPATALHSRFTWDDGEAARQHRLWQAREVIRVCVTILPGSNDPVRTYVSLTSDRIKEGGGYRATEAVLASAEQRAELLDQALRELATWQAKYRQINELAAIFAEAEKVRKQAAKKAKPKVAERQPELV